MKRSLVILASVVAWQASNLPAAHSPQPTASAAAPKCNCGCGTKCRCCCKSKAPAPAAPRNGAQFCKCNVPGVPTLLAPRPNLQPEELFVLAPPQSDAVPQVSGHEPRLRASSHAPPEELANLATFILVV